MSATPSDSAQPATKAEGNSPPGPTIDDTPKAAARPGIATIASAAAIKPGTATVASSFGQPLLALAATGFDEETRRLLHYRLAIVHSAGSVVLAGLVSMNLVGDSILPEESGVGRKILGFSWIVFLECCAGAMYLWRRPELSLATLRVIEVVVFSLFALVGSAVKFAVLTAPYHIDHANGRHADLLLRYGSSVTNLPLVFALLLYGVLIPNTRRRSLTVVAVLCFVPLAVTGLAAAINPALRPSLGVVLPMTAMNVFMGGVVAVVSAARTQSLRKEVYEARREAREVGPYTLKRKLGEGGMGEVYLAEHKLLKRPCAVKFIRAELAANQANAIRFEREVRAMTTLSHFNTVRIYDYGRADDGSFYYVMEYLDGHTLDSLIRTAGPLDPARAIYLLQQLCGALAEAHAAGLIHRDLKPGNILVATLGGQHDVAKLLDFGLVHELGTMDSDPRLTKTGTVLGTPAYMCPEQAGGETGLDARGDVYSLGAVAFFVLAGRPPFEGQSLGKLLAAHLTQPAPFLTEVRKDIPDDLAQVVKRCLAKDPAERFQSVVEMEQALAACACAANWSAAQAATWWAQNGDRAGTSEPGNVEPKVHRSEETK